MYLDIDIAQSRGRAADLPKNRALKSAYSISPKPMPMGEFQRGYAILASVHKSG